MSHGHKKVRTEFAWVVALAAVLFAVQCKQALGKPPVVQASIIGDTTASEYTLVEVKTDTPGTGFAWFIMGPRGMEAFRAVAANRSSVVFVGPPGKYTIMLVVQTKGGGLDQAHSVVTIQGEVNPTPPNPTPPVPPGPDPPTPGKKHVIIISERGDQSNRLRVADIEDSPKLRQYLLDNGHKIRLSDDDNPAPWLKPYLKLIAEKKIALPVLAVVGLDGAGVSVVPLPADAAATIAAIQKAGG